MNTKKVIGVIGAGFGDEGKGKTVSYFCEKYLTERPIVIRYNGGAQAAHNVILDEGVHHTFSHFGSGTLYNIPTYFRDQFIVNPILFMDELKRLNALGGNSFTKYMNPITIFDPNCRVSVPYDMLYNLAVENSRGKNNHGTCGVGIQATIVRYREIPDSPTLKQLLFGETEHFTQFANYMEKSRDYYREKLKLLNDVDEYLEALENENTLINFWYTLQDFKKHSRIMDFKVVIGGHDVFICEGAQGLLLNEKYGIFPFLTPSDTGATEVVKVANEVSYQGDCELELNFITRAYATRHGAGPLIGEDTAENLGICTKDEINDNNGNQGVFRYAPLDIEGLVNVIKNDSTDSTQLLDTKVKLLDGCLVINGCDQLKDISTDEVIATLRNDPMLDKMNFVFGIGPKTNDMLM